MRVNTAFSLTILSCLAIAGGRAARVLQGNDDGWAELYVRSFNDALNAAGHDVVLSCPADNESGTGSDAAAPTPRREACEYDSCPANSGPTGYNATNRRLNWVNSYPSTSMQYGIDTFGPQFWNKSSADIAVSGPNVGSNLGPTVLLSGTVGAAVYAAHNAGIPAVAFSGASIGALAWDTSPVPTRILVYAELSTQLTNAILASGAPYLPSNVWLNVNYPEVTGHCTMASDFKWVLSRINRATPQLTAADVETCGSDRLPTESDVIDAGGCQIAVSTGNGTDKTDVSSDQQAVVLQKLESMLSCLS